MFENNDLSYYHQLVKDLRRSSFREKISSTIIQELGEHLVISFEELKQLCTVSRVAKEICQPANLLLECLRNCCISCERNQLIIVWVSFVIASIKLDFLLEGNETAALETVVKFLQLYCTKQFSKDCANIEKICKLSLQFLGNLVVGNKECQDAVWSRMFPEILMNLLETLPSSQKDTLCMVIFNCVRERSETWKSHEFSLVVIRIMEFVKSTDSEWGMLILEHMILESQFPKIYQHLSEYHEQRTPDNQEQSLSSFGECSCIFRLTLLDLLMGYLNDEKFLIPEKTIAFVSEVYQETLASIKVLEHADDGTVKKLADLNLALLSTLCSASGCLNYQEITKDDQLLDSVVSQLKELSLNTDKYPVNTAPVTLENKGVLGLKRDLVRLIGNLCYNNKSHQDRVRELGGIPAVLNNCGIDDENPYIGQWAVFAIRNLCDNNVANQQLISQFEKQGGAGIHEKLGININRTDRRIQISSQKPRT